MCEGGGGIAGTVASRFAVTLLTFAGFGLELGTEVLVKLAALEFINIGGAALFAI
jgi:hypothetical protein